jgi:hypothetical protein
MAPFGEIAGIDYSVSNTRHQYFCCNERERYHDSGVMQLELMESYLPENMNSVQRPPVCHPRDAM